MEEARVSQESDDFIEGQVRHTYYEITAVSTRVYYSASASRIIFKSLEVISDLSLKSR